MSDADVRLKVSERLATFLTLLTGVLAVVAAFRDGLARTALNHQGWLAVGALLAVASVVVAGLSMVFAARRAAVWAALCVFSLAAGLTGIAAATFSVRQASVAYDKPHVSAAFDGKQLSFTAGIDLLQADAVMTVTVYGYPPGVTRSVAAPGRTGESRGSELFFASSGPAPDGTATLEGEIAVAADSYETVEVRVYRGEDPGCLQVDVEERKDRAACATVWLQPLPPDQ